MKLSTGVLAWVQMINAGLLAGLVQAAPLRTDFAFRGYLTDGGHPAAGVYDFRLRLFDAVTEGQQIAGPMAVVGVFVTNGSFALNLDFGPAIFTPQPLWLEVSVRPAQSTNAYTLLLPRQPLAPVPVALFSIAAGTLLGPSVDASNLMTDVVGTAHLQNCAVTGEKIAQGQIVRSVNSLRDDVVIQGGPGITVSQTANAISIGLDNLTLGSEKIATITSRTGVTTAYPSLAAALAAVCDGETILVYANQTVTAQKVGDGTRPELAGLFLTNRSDITISGVGTPTIYSPTYGDYLFIKDCTNVTISGLAFDGPGSNPAEPGVYCMINFGGTNKNLTVRNCKFTNFGNQGVAHLYGDKTSSFVTVEGCYFYNGGTTQQPELGVDGAAIAGIGSHWTVINNKIENCSRGIEIEGIGPTRQSGILITHNILQDIWQEGICLFATSMVSSNYTDIVIEGNVISGKPEPPEGVSVQTGIDLQGGERITIADNIVADMPQGIFGIGVNSGWADIRDCAIRGNIIRNIGGRGIQLARVYSRALESCIVSANHVQKCGDRGIIVSGTRNLVSGNICQSNRGTGIEVYRETASTDLNTVIGNVCYGNSSYGIAVMAGATNTLLSQNNCFDNAAGQTYLAPNKSEPPLEKPAGPQTGEQP
jgi:hypothetical protein